MTGFGVGGIQNPISFIIKVNKQKMSTGTSTESCQSPTPGALILYNCLYLVNEEMIFCYIIRSNQSESNYCKILNNPEEIEVKKTVKT